MRLDGIVDYTGQRLRLDCAVGVQDPPCSRFRVHHPPSHRRRATDADHHRAAAATSAASAASSITTADVPVHSGARLGLWPGPRLSGRSLGAWFLRIVPRSERRSPGHDNCVLQ
jgi:hypothetical protein